MLPDNVREFCTNNHRGVLTAFRRNGAAQMSIITCGAYQDGVAFTVTGDPRQAAHPAPQSQLHVAGLRRGVAALRGAGRAGPHHVGQQHRRR